MNIVISHLSFARFTMILWFLFNASVTLADETAALAAFNEINAFDIETARIAAQKGASQGVRDLGQMIVVDHDHIQKEVSRIADELGLMPPVQGSNAEYANTLKSLKSTSGPAFDKAYMEHELPFSKDFIRKLKEEIIPAVTHEKLKVYLQDLVLKFEEHLMHIKHTAMQLEMGSQGEAMHEKK